MNNKSSKIIIIILTILVIGLTGYIVYDKVLSTNETQEKNETTNIEQYTFSDFSGTVFSKKDGSGDNTLILWNNGTYSYDGSLGNYIVEGKSIRLNYMFKNNQKVTKEETIELTINSTTELIDNKNHVILGKVNQPTGLGNWYFYEDINAE